MKNNLVGLPRVFWVTLSGEYIRQEHMVNQFCKYDIYPAEIKYGFDGRAQDAHDIKDISGNYLESMSSGDIACAISHLSMIEKWVNNYPDEEYALFLEDDVDLSISDNWNFTWSDIIANLPRKWNAIQLCLIREADFSDISFHQRTNINWSVTAYMLKRDYAKQLIKSYKADGKWWAWNLALAGDPKAIPYVENLIYFPAEPHVYTLPIFVEKTGFGSNFYEQKSGKPKKEKINNIRSANIVNDWWAKNGKSTSILDLMRNNVLMLNDFKWGEDQNSFDPIVCQEIFGDRVYERYRKVKTGDIVMDIGANVGAFTHSILPVYPKQVFCVEPSTALHKTLEHNVANSNVKIIKVAMTDSAGVRSKSEKDNVFLLKSGEEYQCDTFENVVKTNGIDRIDFLKIDCESGEYDVFTEKNKEFIIENVDYVAGEWHVWGFDNIVEKFAKFRDVYLREHNSFVVTDRQGKDITKDIFSDQFIVDFGARNTLSAQVMIYMDNSEHRRRAREIKNIRSIPVLGTAIVTNPFWIKRLIASIDYPVDNFVIINNNGRGEIDAELDQIVKEGHPLVKKMKVCHMPANLGVSGAWNLIIKSYMMSPFWIIVNDDVSFGPGFLNEMYDRAMSDPQIGVIHGYAGDFDLGSWDLFLIRDHIIQSYGLFDENLYPAYNEDADYMMRFIHRPIKKVVSLNSMYYHGFGEKGKYYEEGSQTQKSDTSLKPKLDRINNINIEYMTEKWGSGWRMCSPTKDPFQNKMIGSPISTTTYDLSFVRSKYLGF